jgi:hypothetical protein
MSEQLAMPSFPLTFLVLALPLLGFLWQLYLKMTAGSLLFLALTGMLSVLGVISQKKNVCL